MFSLEEGVKKRLLLWVPGADDGASPEVHEGSSASFGFRQEDRGLDPGAKGRFP